LGQEDLFMAHEETTLDPSVDGHSDGLSEVNDTFLIVIVRGSVVDGLKEEGLEGLERVLVHVIDNAKLDKQEVKGGTLGRNTSVNLTKVVDSYFGLFSLNLLTLNLSGCGLGHFEGLNQRDVRENSVGVSIREILKQVRLKLGESSNELILLVH
jgi:hypothetical protein